MTGKKVKNWELLKLRLYDDIKHVLKHEKLSYNEDAIWKLARHSLEFIVRILNDADDFKNDDAIQKENVSLALVMETENRLAICQPLPYRELIDISVVYNSKELPEIKTSYGLRIPFDNLAKANYKLKSKSKELQSRKSTLYNQLTNHLTYMNPFMSNPMQLPHPLCVPTKSVLNAMTPLQVSSYATLYAPQHPPTLTPLSLPQHLSYMQQPTISTTASHVPQQSRPSAKPQYSYPQEMQMTPQRLVFRPRFNIVTRKENNTNSNNKRKSM